MATGVAFGAGFCFGVGLDSCHEWTHLDAVVIVGAIGISQTWPIDSSAIYRPRNDPQVGNPPARCQQPPSIQPNHMLDPISS
jgi:hypothetical protein